MARYPEGSNPVLTESLIERLSDAIRQGAYVETASALCGISKDTFYRWLRQASEDDASALIVKLSDAVRRSMAEAEMRDLAVIDAAAQMGHWQAAAWRLERKFPQKWGRQAKLQLEHSGPEGKAIQIDDKRAQIKRLIQDPSALAAMEVLEKKLGGSDGSDPNGIPTQ